MVTIEEYDKKGKKVKKEVTYDEESYSSNDSENMGLDFMERMLNDEFDDSEEAPYDNDDDYYEQEDDDEDDDQDDDEIEEQESEYDDSEHESGDEQDEDNQVDEAINFQVGGGGDEKWTLDLRNLLAINNHQIDYAALYKPTTENVIKKEKVTIDMEQKNLFPNDDYLLQKASEGCTHLLTGLWRLGTQKSDAGPMAILPSFFEMPTPRSLPPPAPKAETKWEKFAKERRIAPKEKRSRKVWDESTQSWAHLTGSGKAALEKEWPIMEVKKGDDPYEDPWQKQRDAKKNRIDKNIENRMRNEERTGNLMKGTTMRTVKGLKRAREVGRDAGSRDMRPAGLPVDLSQGQKRGKELTKVALLATQRSTASLGKFDEMREGEPERKKMKQVKKRKFEGATDRSVVNNESAKSLRVLQKVMSGGKEKEKDARKGKFSKGETGHDYDFDDGLGPSSFKKKKGRAGMGKMKKITKKRMA